MNTAYGKFATSVALAALFASEAFGFESIVKPFFPVME